MDKQDRIVSFSILPGDTTTRDVIRRLRRHCRDTGKNFSRLMASAVHKVAEEHLPKDAEAQQ